MKTLFTSLLLFFSILANAQFKDSSLVISTKTIPLRHVKTKKIIGYISPGDTVAFINTRSANYFYVFDWKTEKRGLVNVHSLDSAINFQTAIDKENRDNKLYYKYLKLYGIKFAQDLVDKELKIGMTEEMVELIKGHPTKSNLSHYSSGTFVQWVYEDKSFPAFTKYYYFKNDILTSWQE